MYFVGYVERSKGHKFYCLSHSIKFEESRNARFLKNDKISMCVQFWNLILEKISFKYFQFM